MSRADGGAVLEITANGATPGFQSFLLPQGFTLRGKSFWRRLGTRGFRCHDPHGEQGPVKSVLLVHMEAGNDPQDEIIRDRSVTQLVAFIATFSAGRAVVIGGDFNLNSDREPDGTIFQRLLTEAGLTDVCAALACPEPGRIDKFLFRNAANLALTPLSWRLEADAFIGATANR